MDHKHSNLRRFGHIERKLNNKITKDVLQCDEHNMCKITKGKQGFIIKQEEEIKKISRYKEKKIE